ncbi:MAG: 50S ribosomal protein L23, partial [Proteobacteria bacterium]|nr:50S ribosomal protein L23 [Pseudomonadota bacterium]
MDYTQVLLRPVVSEKANEAKEESGHVAFFVHPKANKVEVKKAVETVFGVKVMTVNMVNRKPLSKSRFGRSVGKISGYKKAYVK